MSRNTLEPVSRLRAISLSLPSSAVGLATLAMSGIATAGPAAPFVTPPPTPRPPVQVTVNETNNHHVVTVPRGAVVTLVLHSTSWRLAGSSRSGTLRAIDRPTYHSVVPPSPGCHPGMACGTVTEHFKAQADGDAVLSAGRTACGEVVRCTPANDAYTVTIRVH